VQAMRHRMGKADGHAWRMADDIRFALPKI
jgi:hypothetical protein